MYPTYLRTMILLLVLFSLCSCNTYKPVNMKAINNNVAEIDIAKKKKNLDPKRIFTIGDKIKITTKDGKFFTLKVTSVTSNSIHGEKRSVDIQDIAVLETNSYRALALASAGAAGTAYYVVVINAVLKKMVIALIAF